MTFDKMVRPMIRIAWILQITISLIFLIAAFLSFYNMDMNKGYFIILLLPILLIVAQMCKILLVKYIQTLNSKRFWKKFINYFVLFFIIYVEFTTNNWFIKIYLDQSLSTEHYLVSFLIVAIAPTIAFIGYKNS